MVGATGDKIRGRWSGSPADPRRAMQIKDEKKKTPANSGSEPAFAGASLMRFPLRPGRPLPWRGVGLLNLAGEIGLLVSLVLSLQRAGIVDVGQGLHVMAELMA